MKLKIKKEILGIRSPDRPCQDAKCPFHGILKVKKEFIQGRLIKKDVYHSATIEWQRPYFVPKYERYEVRRYRLRVHNPACLDAGPGDEVLAARTRPLSKTKNYVLLQILAKRSGMVESGESGFNGRGHKPKSDEKMEIPPEGQDNNENTNENNNKKN